MRPAELPDMMSVPQKSFAPEAPCPLDGVRVVDLSRLGSGNMLSLQLADQGAEVVKIEDPKKGDPLRAWRVKGQSLYWKVYARNKKSLALNLRAPEGLEIVRISGFGQDGPYRDRPGFGSLVEDLSGFAAKNGFPDRPPVLPPLALAD